MEKWSKEWVDLVFEEREEAEKILMTAAAVVRKIGLFHDSTIYTVWSPIINDNTIHVKCALSAHDNIHVEFPIKFLTEDGLNIDGLTEWTKEKYKIKRQKAKDKRESAKLRATNAKEKRERKQLASLLKKYGDNK